MVCLVGRDVGALERHAASRINRFVPTGTILEIAPGYGRWTQYLQGLCEQLVVVDLTENCIDHCRKRFADLDHITYHVNDGRSLAMIEDESIDFVFSFDSLVHVELDVLEAYLAQLGAKLRPGGAGFIHHSNAGSYRRPQLGGPSGAGEAAAPLCRSRPRDGRLCLARGERHDPSIRGCLRQRGPHPPQPGGDQLGAWPVHDRCPLDVRPRRVARRPGARHGSEPKIPAEAQRYAPSSTAAG